MCGIIGYVGDRPALPILSSGLSNLEYRGYDSAGVALTDDALSVYKTSGEVSELQGILPESTDHTRGIGHTRWSTHGPPTDENAHPHTDCTGRVAVVHNGIIENYDALREELSDHAFTSDTDTEVVPHLIEAELDAGAEPRAAVEAAIERLEGTYAVVVTIAGVDEVYATRRDSPLVVGHAADGTFLASDVTAFLEHTREVTYVEDGDFAVLGEDGLSLYRDGEAIEPPVETLEYEADAAEKSGYDHYMLKEIHEQPRALRQTISGRIDADDGTVDVDVDLPSEYVDSIEEIQIVACGTSNYAGRYAAELLESVVDVRTTVEVASEYEFDGGRDPWRTLVVAVTQSGETADTLSAIRRAKRAGARTLAVTNTLGSTIVRETDDSVFIRAGPEIGVAATKTFASQVATLTLLAVRIGRARGSLSYARARELLESVRRLPNAVQGVLDREDRIREVAREYADSDAFFFVGRRFGHPVALEGALKLKEISYDHAEGFPAGELKHGPLALVTDETPVLALLTDGSRPDETLNNVKEVQARGAPVIGATTADGDGEVAADPTHLDVDLPVPAAGVLEPLVANVYWQLFAYHVADEKGRPIDRPRNLAKSVTVE
ncbi:glutamine--fructose-6-phosphate transaminase (isomerizing) [Halorubrum halodurans]|uniref:Glutamine--fructose-6-phosphate aminotransferase [isomerizing] n=1 Tax=Halorubrum halodurans TaxID=1383851 RepID=A0A256IPT2_9EURY|nr:glutamine--fructose-6-phosphate transaminase (isomerizing) [Halorubrum halodurans]OYR58554.1 glutamine--fructose-6-phosphate transaminase (isomerizing) [Halorubrum halodurans]